MSRQTCLHALHQECGARLVDFAGWSLPVQFQGVLAEHQHCRTAAALFDTSHMGQALIAGPDAPEQLALALTQDAVALRVGRGRYGLLLNEAGGIVDDTILFRLGEEEFLLVVNAGTAAGDFALLAQRLGGQTEMRVLADWAKADLQGPASFDVLAPLVEADLRTLPYFGTTRTRILGCEGIVSRSGYTGELGYELFLPAADLPAVARELLAREPVLPAGLGARDSLRLEMGYPLYGHELNEQTHPVEAGMEMFLPKGVGRYVGAGAVEQARTAGPARRLVGLQTNGRPQFHPDDAILRDGQEVGRVTSGAFSPSLGVAIGMGYVRPDAAAAGCELTIRTARRDIPAVVADRPLYHDGTCRRKLT